MAETAADGGSCRPACESLVADEFPSGKLIGPKPGPVSKQRPTGLQGGTVRRCALGLWQSADFALTIKGYLVHVHITTGTSSCG